jgi:ribosomal protein L11 methyltransferase
VLLVVRAAADELDALTGRLWLSGVVTAVVEQPLDPGGVELRVGIIETATEDEVDSLVRGLAPRWRARRIDDSSERSAVVESVRADATVVRAGSHLVVAPPWLDPATVAGDVVVTIDPGLAFGSGSHPTTVMALAALERVVLAGARVLDVGCGTGVLAVAAARLGATPVVAIDIDPHAVAATAGNVERNGVAGAVTVIAGDVSRVAASPAFDVVVANLTAGTVIELAAAITDRLAPSGVAVLTGILDELAAEVADGLAVAGLVVRDRQSVEGWTRLEATNGP